jgi:hypothetical protein
MNVGYVRPSVSNKRFTHVVEGAIDVLEVVVCSSNVGIELYSCDHYIPTIP